MAQLRVRVVPRAKGNQIAGWEGDTVKVRLTAPPVEGKANKALVDFLAEQLGVSKSAVTIVSGHSARQKRIEIAGLDDVETRRKLGKPA
ncbi:MAG: DUF167 domain-containing protein [Dehalococcoidales bacterium]|nr:DUF167 domain-containing protein [Dehalococcoidales bacterium]